MLLSASEADPAPALAPAAAAEEARKQAQQLEQPQGPAVALAAVGAAVEQVRQLVLECGTGGKGDGGVDMEAACGVRLSGGSPRAAMGRAVHKVAVKSFVCVPAAAVSTE